MQKQWSMAFIFMDESGDLGFDFSKQKTSRFFVVTFLFVPSAGEVKKVRKIIKRIFAGFTKQEARHHSGVMHAFREKPATRRRLLTRVAKRSVSVLAIVLNKQHVYTTLQASHTHRMDLDITIRTPAQEKCLQVTDCVSWALFRKLEHGDPTYADIVRGIIAEEAPLFP